MTVRFHKQFEKQHKRLTNNHQQQFQRRFELFVSDIHHPSLRLHPLKGKWQGYYSINITGDVRAIIQLQDERVIFVAIGSHSQLY